MNVLHINQTDKVGGAAIAAYRLHQGLLAKGINSSLLVSSKASSERLVELLPARSWFDYKLRRVLKPLGINDLHLLSSFAIPKQQAFQNAEIIQFHNLHTDYINYLSLPLLTQAKPAVLMLHDMWAFTGHCAYSFDCERWKLGCGKCPYLTSDPAINRDSTSLQWRLKRWSYSRSNISAIVTTSQWMRKYVEQSILNAIPIHCIPIGLNINTYRPLGKEQSRRILNIPLQKRVLLFVAQHITNHRKGGDLLFQALKQLPEKLKSELLLMILGSGGEALTESLGLPTLNLGFVESDHLKAVAYSAADLFLFPTRADSFGLVAQESIACGTPVVAFKVGGVPDIVRPSISGLLAEPENPTSFRDAIVQLLEDSETRHRMGKAGRAIAESEYSIELYAQRYIDLYKKVLQSA